MSSRTATLLHGGHAYGVTLHPDGRTVVDGNELRVRRATDGSVRIESARATTAWVAAQGDTRWVFIDGRTYVFELQRPRSSRRRHGGHHASLTAPMPATVRRILVAVGDRISRGDTLVILEAMKMELPVKASTDGVVEAINCSEGELVQPGTALVELESGEESA